MNDQLIEQLFTKTNNYRETFPHFFYEISWGILKKEGLVQESTPLKNYFYGCVLIDLYRKFEKITNGEEWSIHDELEYPKDPNYQYENICELLNIEPNTIYDFYTQDEIDKNEWQQADIEEILRDEQPSFAEIYIEHIRQPYQTQVFSVLKKHLAVSDLYCIIMNAVSYDHFNKQYEQWEEDTNEDYEFEFFDMDTLDDFNNSLERNRMHILNDMQFIRSYEWLDAIY